MINWVKELTWVNWIIIPQAIFLVYIVIMIAFVKGEVAYAFMLGFFTLIPISVGFNSNAKDEVMGYNNIKKALVLVGSLFIYYSMFLVITDGFENALDSIINIIFTVAAIALVGSLLLKGASNGHFDGAFSKNTNSNTSTTSYANNSTPTSSSNKNDKHIGNYDYYYKAKTSNGIQEFNTNYTIEYADDRGTMKVIDENGNILPHYNDSFSTIQGIIEKDLKDKGMITLSRYNKL